MEHRQRGAEDCGGDGLAVDGHLGLVEVQPSLAVHEERQLAVLDRVVASSRLVVVLQRPVNRSEPVAGSRHGVDQPVARRVFVVVQVADRALTLRAGIQRVDEHVGDRRRPRDLDAGTSQVLRDWGYAPVGGVDLRDGRVRGHDAVFQGAAQHLGALGPQVVYSPYELVVRRDEVPQEFRREYLIRPFDARVLQLARSFRTRSPPAAGSLIRGIMVSHGIRAAMDVAGASCYRNSHLSAL